MMPRLPLLVLCTIAIFAVGIHATSIRKSIGGRTGNVVTKTASVEPDIMYRCVAGMTATLSPRSHAPARNALSIGMNLQSIFMARSPAPAQERLGDGRR